MVELPARIIGGPEHVVKIDGARYIANIHQAPAAHTLYPLELLEKNVAKFDGANVRIEHRSGPAVGTVQAPIWSLQAVYAVLVLRDSDKLQNGVAGVSAVYNELERSNHGAYDIITKIGKVGAVDIVKRPQAGGKIVTWQQLRRAVKAHRIANNVEKNLKEMVAKNDNRQ